MYLKKWSIYALLLANATYAQQDTTVNQSKQNLQEVVITAIKANKVMPITQTTLTKKQIESRYYGADVPTVINYTPSINMVSDNGTGIGYSSFRLRGMEQTRINTTINGIPVNDAENQGVFFNNFADLMSSAESVQIQRGIGTSTNGTSSFGGSINIFTKNLTEKTSAAINVGYGSFNSHRITTEFQSGLLHNRVMFYGRLSNISTDGYRQNSGSKINSYAFSGAYKMKNAILKFNTFGGSTQNQLSYLGVDKTTLDANRKSNPFVNNETDAFEQNFYQLQYTHQISSKQSFHISPYYVIGGAPKFQFLFPSSWGYDYAYFNMQNPIIGQDTLLYTGDMMTSYRLKQKFYGVFLNYNLKLKNTDIVTGVHANSLHSTHLMEINWGTILPAGSIQNQEVYNNTGNKNEVSAFIKTSHNITSAWSVFVDAQVRNATFSYAEKQMAIRNFGYSVENMNWTFMNWRLGSRYYLNNANSVYAMIGQSYREPTRFDYFQDDFATRDIKQKDINPEMVLDFESGYEYSNRNIYAKVNAYLMLFSNQIIGLGQLNVFGYPITTNVNESKRMGIETEIVLPITKHISLTNYSSFSNNTIKNITQFYTTSYSGIDTSVQYSNVTLAYSPSVIINQGIQVKLSNWFDVELMYRYVGMQYLDNTQTKDVSIPTFNYIDGRINVQLKNWIKVGEPVFSLRLNNITNKHYASSGSVGSGTNMVDNTGKNLSVPLYFPAATLNYFATLSWMF
ncbi:MAG: TonB-dependent receptor plug domain-containing protein [Bacteroidia bacterium]|nr:TonB-dependent receptor plug domain-containing protein [Bacteroidia bacterium]